MAVVHKHIQIDEGTLNKNLLLMLHDANLRYQRTKILNHHDNNFVYIMQIKQTFTQKNPLLYIA
jgi:hypothetical protein